MGLPQAGFLLQTMCVMDDLRLCLSLSAATHSHAHPTHTYRIEYTTTSYRLCTGQMSVETDLGQFLNFKPNCSPFMATVFLLWLHGGPCHPVSCPEMPFMLASCGEKTQIIT